MEFRVGQGVDLHQWEDGEGKQLRLGGVHIPHARGLKAHSDGDALLHAVTDALAGAAGLGDIGQFFPDTDPRYKNADSRLFLQEVVGIVQKQGWRVVNVDTTIVSDAPKIAPHRTPIQESLAELLQIQPSAVGVKATTPEKMGALGRSEGLLALAVILLMKE